MGNIFENLFYAFELKYRKVVTENLVQGHTASFWNIIIQLTSHDDLTEN